jgi:hypothetical protein
MWRDSTTVGTVEAVVLEALVAAVPGGVERPLYAAARTSAPPGRRQQGVIANLPPQHQELHRANVQMIMK